MPAKIIAVDFDGTLCTNTWPAIGAPKNDVIKYVLQQQAQGAKLILWTNRTNDRLSEALEWCNQHDLHFDAVNENLPECVKLFGSDSRKIFADAYLDDKAMTPEDAEKIAGSRRRTCFRNHR